MEEDMFAKAYELERLNLPFAIVTIIGAEGIVPRRSGRMLVAEDGSTWSTVGGHLVEEAAIKASLEAISEGMGRIIDVSTGRGSVRLMVDVVKKAKRAYIIGYGHVGQAVAKALHSVGYAIYIHDIAPAECPWAAGVRVGGNWNEALSGLVLDKSSALVVTVHGSDDVLPLIDCSNAFYAGILSSRSRVIPGKDLHAPIGLDIGARTPEEIAISVAAEVMKAYSGRSGLPGRERRRRFVLVSGNGEIAEKAALRLLRSGYDVLAVGSIPPSHAFEISSPELCFHVLDEGRLPVFSGSAEEAAAKLKPLAAVGIGSAGRNMREMAPFTVAAGPGLTAAEDADAVIETLGEDVGCLLRSGSTFPGDSLSIPSDAIGSVTGAILEAVDSFFSAF